MRCDWKKICQPPSAVRGFFGRSSDWLRFASASSFGLLPGRSERWRSLDSLARSGGGLCGRNQLLGNKLLGNKLLRESARSHAETVPPALDLPKGVVASLDRAHERYIEALVVLKSSLKGAAVIERGCRSGRRDLDLVD